MAYFICSPTYAGYLVVHLDESLRTVPPSPARLARLAFPRHDAVVSSILAKLARHPGTSLESIAQAPAGEVDFARLQLEKLSGQKLADWNSVYHVKAELPADAVALMNELKALPGVTKVYPALKPIPTGLATTPDLTGWQSYLYAEAQYGGLNAKAAWDKDVKGDGVYVIDNEHGMNFDHEDLGLVAKPLYEGGNYLMACLMKAKW
jgi:hypothetical protein